LLDVLAIIVKIYGPMCLKTFHATIIYGNRDPKANEFGLFLLLSTTAATRSVSL